MSAGDLRSETLMQQAMEEAGLSDFGPGDFREGLEVLLESIERDADLSPEALEQVAGDLRRRLVNRLEVEAWYGAHPGLEGLPLRGPIDIVGLPRTGTTALGAMMSLDPQLRPLRGWEQAKPCPPPRLDEEDRDPRRLEALRADEQVAPELKAMHIYDTDAAMEDTEILGMAFHGQQYTLPVFGYHDWWRRSDCRSTFAYHRRVVTLLGSQRPPDLWLFKAPHHKFHLEAIVEAYPDARFIMTHRDPSKVVPSYTSLVSSIFPPARRARDVARIGREVCEHLRIGMEQCIAARERLGEDRFLDVHHVELHANPMGTLERIYDWLGLALGPELRRALAAWHDRNRSGAHGEHRYTAEQFGLSREQLLSDYDFYVERFGVEVGR